MVSNCIDCIECNECNESKEIQEYPSWGVNKNRNICKQCVRKIRNIQNREKRCAQKKLIVNIDKQCVNCNEIKINKEFPSKGTNKDKCICKKCVIKIGNKKHYEEKKDEILIRQKVYNQNNKNLKRQTNIIYRQVSKSI